MTEYNYDRSDIYPPDFRDEYDVRHFDHSRAENEYFEYFRERPSLRNYRREDRSLYEYNKSRIRTSTRGLYGFGHGSQDGQVDQNDDDMSQLENIGSNRPNPFNFYRVRTNGNYWF